MPRRLSLQGSARREAFTPGSMIGNNEVVRTASARDVWCMRCHAMPCQPFPNSCSGAVTSGITAYDQTTGLSARRRAKRVRIPARPRSARFEFVHV